MQPQQKTNLEEEERLKSFLLHLQTESGILERIVYKGKNQHRRCPYFQALFKVRRDVRLLQSAGLEEILSSVFPIVDANKLAQKAHLPIRLKKKYPIGKHNYQERLLGVARLLSQMAEPILKAGIQISFLLAKSFFTGFSLTVLALLARLRVLVQQILLDVVSVFNKVSSLSQKKIPLKLTRGGIEAFRERYPSDEDVLALECAWEKDKFVLFERTHKRDIKGQDVDRGALPSATSIKYETIKLFNEVESTEHELRPEIQMDFHTHDSRPIDIEPAINSSAAESESCSVGINIVDCEDGKDSVARKGADSASEGNQSADSDPETKLRKKKVAFIPVRVPRPSETAGPSKKKMKVDLLASDAMKADDPFLSLLLGGGTNSTLF